MFDIVRGALIFPDMSSMLMALSHLLASSQNAGLQNFAEFELGDARKALRLKVTNKAGDEIGKEDLKVRLVRVKNRLLEPTAGGWCVRDRAIPPLSA